MSLVIPGEPIAKGRPRFGKGRAFTPEATRDYDEWVAWHARVAMRGKELLAGPLALSLSAIHAIPASWPKKRREAAVLAQPWKESKPDIDNLIKAVTDGMNGIVYSDDAQIVKLRDCDKRWGLEPHVFVLLETLA